MAAEVPLWRYPLPGDAQSSLDWVSSAPPEIVVKFLASHLDLLDILVMDAKSAHEVWDNAIPDPLRLVGGMVKVAALHRPMSHFCLWGDAGVSQFVFGVPATGILSQEGVSPFSENVKPPIAPSALWKSSSDRFREGAEWSGFKKASPLGRRVA